MGTSVDTRVQTLRWVDDHLEMIDQRILPSEFRYLSYRTASEVAEGIRSMVVRGAPAIGCAAAYGVALEALALQSCAPADFHFGMARAFETLSASRPTAVNLFWALNRMKAQMASHDDQAPKVVAQALLGEAHAVFSEDIEVNKALGIHGAALLNDGDRVLTHCNAGALATAGHGTALGVIRSAVAMGKRIEVIADETRPFLQGARLTAWEMVQEGIPTTLISDGMAGHLMATGCIDAIIVGADRVARNGDVANKIGTYMVAVLARRHAIPFYVACPLSTIDMSIPSGAAIPIEERAATEVLGHAGLQWAAPGLKVRNPAFDITPGTLVTALITERGVLKQPTEEGLRLLSAGSNWLE
jgi:methylthioribose-1-phosphate isomerase